MPLFLKNLFNSFSFKRPVFVHLEYVDFIIENNAYFLVSWEYIKANKLSISGIQFASRKRKGSAYILVPKEISKIKVSISNFLYSISKEIELNKFTIKDKIEYDFIIKSASLRSNLVNRPMEFLIKDLSTFSHKIHLRNRDISVSTPIPTFIIRK